MAGRRINYTSGNIPEQPEERNSFNMSPKKLLILIASAAAVIFLLSISTQLVEVNDAGHYQILQGMTGNMSVHNEAGPYFQAMGKVTDYPISDTLRFTKSDEEDDEGAIQVRFNDASLAEVSGTLQFRLPQVEDSQLALHRDYRGFASLKHNMVRPLVRSALMQAATLMRAEESYSSRRAEFQTIAEEQIRLGIFETISSETQKDDVEGNDFIERTIGLKLDAAGKPVVSKASPFDVYKIEIVQFTIAEIDFDDTVDKLISKKKEAEQQKVVARANAERAKQDAITSLEQGKARIAEAQATKEVEKIEAVTQARKEFEVAELNKKRDKENAEAGLIARRAEAEANKLLVNSGLTPEKRAEFDMKTAIGVAEQLAKLQLPTTMVFGGGGKDSPTNPFDAVGLKAFMDITDKMSANK